MWEELVDEGCNKQGVGVGGEPYTVKRGEGGRGPEGASLCTWQEMGHAAGTGLLGVYNIS